MQIKGITLEQWQATSAHLAQRLRLRFPDAKVEAWVTGEEDPRREAHPNQFLMLAKFTRKDGVRWIRQVRVPLEMFPDREYLENYMARHIEKDREGPD